MQTQGSKIQPNFQNSPLSKQNVHSPHVDKVHIKVQMEMQNNTCHGIKAYGASKIYHKVFKYATWQTGH